MHNDYTRHVLATQMSLSSDRSCPESEKMGLKIVDAQSGFAVMEAVEALKNAERSKRVLCRVQTHRQTVRKGRLKKIVAILLSRKDRL